ncbi:MAG: TIGR04076 family protein [Deltaproteobacteria bacterium]|nr:TIGR04076 family protein [Deltaproteobacteria bacterium]
MNVLYKLLPVKSQAVFSQKGTCQFGHQVDDLIVFDGERIQGRICMSALYSFMPKVFALRYGADFPWLKDNLDVSTHACPDAFNPVVFEIRRIRD